MPPKAASPKAKPKSLPKKKPSPGASSADRERQLAPSAKARVGAAIGKGRKGATRADAPERANLSPRTREASSSKGAPLPARQAQSAGKKGRLAIYGALKAAHPDAHCELTHKNPFELIVATVLSAQATDVMVNRVTPGLFERFPTPDRLARAKVEEVEACINRIGMFRQKARNIVGLSQMLMERHGGEVPQSLEELVVLPGVGRKTANVVLGVAFGRPEGVVVDTHVSRLSQRLGFTSETRPEKIEADLMALLPKDEWDRVSHTLIFHGRRVCSALRPQCSICPVAKNCPSAHQATLVGRAARKPRPR